jgi:aminopeptidase
MPDHRYEKLADLLVTYSCQLQRGEKVLIETIDIPQEFTNELVRASYRAGVEPLVWIKNQAVLRELLLGATESQMDVMSRSECVAMDGVDAYIGMRGSPNVSELSDVPTEKMQLYETVWWKPVHMDRRVNRTRWVVLRWPNASMAQLAQQSTRAFEDFFFRVCTMDYERMSRAMDPLKDLLNRTDAVRIASPGTDLSLSVKDIPAIECDGHRNIPDGEVFTAPVLDSINGVIQYNTPTVYQGVSHENIRLTFENGRIVDAVSNNSTHLNEVLDSDDGARFVGEFAIGFNPYIVEPMKDILFDEKIAGSIHLTPGNAYEIAFNGNRSQVHWDLVLIQTPEYGGGELWFDDVLVRKDGRFVLPELEALNPENLVD